MLVEVFLVFTQPNGKIKIRMKTVLQLGLRSIQLT